MTGITPVTMPTLTSSWKRIIDARPTEISIPNGSRACQPISRIRQTSSPNRMSRTAPPRKPRSSATTVKMKSVDCTGM